MKQTKSPFRFNVLVSFAIEDLQGNWKFSFSNLLELIIKIKIMTNAKGEMQIVDC